MDLKALAGVLETSKLGMASPERLQKYLGVEPGAVTLLGVINDADGAVEVVIDAEVWAADQVQSHPLVNTSTVAIGRAGFERLLRATGYEPRIVHVPARGGEQ